MFPGILQTMHYSKSFYFHCKHFILPFLLGWHLVEPLRYHFPCSLLKQSIFFKAAVWSHAVFFPYSWSHFFNHWRPGSVFLSSVPSAIVLENLTSLILTYLNIPKRTETFLSPMMFCCPLLNLSYLFFIFHFGHQYRVPLPVLLIQSSHVSAHSITSTWWFWDLIEMSNRLFPPFF